MNASPTRWCLARVLLAIAIAVACGEASGAGVSEAPSKRRSLVVSLDYVAPEYKAGTKFRSAATIDTALAEDLGRRMQLPLATHRAASLPDTARGGVQLTSLIDGAAVPPAYEAIPVGYGTAPMAIMRSDTIVKRWQQLKDHTVCVAQGGHQAGTMAAQYGAIEKVYPALTDALIALRSGACDAMVHDSAMLDELIKFPEWKKFSAHLSAGPRSTLAFVVPVADKETVTALRRVADDWKASAYPDALVKKTVRNIAFEVYLDQDVPDCH